MRGAKFVILKQRTHAASFVPNNNNSSFAQKGNNERGCNQAAGGAGAARIRRSDPLLIARALPDKATCNLSRLVLFAVSPVFSPLYFPLSSHFLLPLRLLTLLVCAAKSSNRATPGGLGAPQFCQWLCLQSASTTKAFVSPHPLPLATKAGGPRW